MKRFLIIMSICLGSLLSAKSQFGDPYIDINMTPPLVTLGANATMEVLTGNFGATPICDNSMIITISVGPNAEILGIGAGSDARWTQSGPLPSGPGNTIQITNTGGSFTAFDLNYVYITVKGVALGGPNNCGGNIAYILANNPCSGGAPNASQGNQNIANDNGVTSLTVSPSLPLHFTSFDIQDNGCGARLTWSTADEQNVQHFEIQQSFDAISFKVVKTVQSKGAGSHEYNVETGQLQKKMYYRVVAVDIDGRRSYGAVQSLKLANCTKASLVQVYPIPAYRDQMVTMQTNVNDKITYRLLDMNGKTVMTGNFVRTAQLKVAISGSYLLEMTGTGFKETQTIVIQ